MMMDFKKEIKLAFSENKSAIIISVIILLLSLILGYCLESHLHAYLNPVVDELTRQVKSGNITLTFQSIFSNNIRIVFLMFVFGLLFCFSALILSFNGFFVGYYIASSGDLFNSLLLIVPHGIFEFSSCIIACSSGFVLFRFAINFIKSLSKSDSDSFLKKMYDSWIMNFDKFKQAVLLLLVATILMIIAGLIEVYLTIPIADFISSAIVKF